jgi:23S rRNA (uracil1939-C5)-methyltransferase
LVIQVEKWVQAGNCLAHFNGETYFIKGAIPNELVRIEIIKKTNKYTLARVQEVLEPSVQRIPTDCEVFPLCGGCSFRHISYENERKVKLENFLEDGQRNQIPYSKSSIQFFFGSELHYRNNFQVHTQDKKIGFFSDMSNKVISLPPHGCKNLNVKLNEILMNTKNIEISKKWRILDFPYPYDKQIGYFSYRGKKFQIPKNGFFQVNTNLLEVWLDEIINQVPSDKKILELFCGSGLISLFLAEKSKFLLGIEVDPSSVKFAKHNVKENQITNVNFLVKNLYTQKLEENSWDLVFANPPRNGLGSLVLEWIKQQRPKQIIYSSCNYQTLNHDLKKILNLGYKLRKVSVFDFFPRTPYFETLVKLEV